MTSVSGDYDCNAFIVQEIKFASEYFRTICRRPEEREGRKETDADQKGQSSACSTFSLISLHPRIYCTWYMGKTMVYLG